MKTKTIRYGLRYKKDGKLLSIHATSNAGGDFCVSVAYELVDWGDDNSWLVESPEHAEFVRHNSTPWYNAGYDSPINNYDAKDLQVVRVITEVEEEEVCVNLPAFEEMMRHMYNTEGHKYYDPRHYIYIMNEYEKAKGTSREKELYYDLFQLFEYLSDKEKEAKLVVEKA
jgi:hypothetical protein